MSRGPSTPVEDLSPTPDAGARARRYWRMPVLVGAGFCTLQLALFAVRFGFSDWDAITMGPDAWISLLSGLVLFFVGGLLVGFVRSADGARVPRCVADIPACGDYHSHSPRHRVQLGGWAARPPLCCPLRACPVSSVARASRTDPQGMVALQIAGGLSLRTDFRRR